MAFKNEGLVILDDKGARPGTCNSCKFCLKWLSTVWHASISKSLEVPMAQILFVEPEFFYSEIPQTAAANSHNEGSTKKEAAAVTLPNDPISLLRANQYFFPVFFSVSIYAATFV